MELAEATKKITNILERKDGSGSFLLSSPKGSGKKQYITEVVGGKLHTENLRSSNLLWISEENNKILIDKVRSIYDFLSKTSYNDFPRIIVIDSADSLNIQASNALLKILEDYSPNTYFFLLCHNVEAVISTVRSRCINLKMPSMSSTLSNENITEMDKEKYLYLTNGSVGLATKFIESSALSFYEEILEIVEKFDSQIEMLYKFLDKNFAKDKAPKNWKTFVSLIHHLMDRIMKFHIGEVSNLIESERRVVEKVANLRDIERWHNVFHSMRRMLVNTEVSSLSMYNVALLSFFKIRMKKDVE